MNKPFPGLFETNAVNEVDAERDQEEEGRGNQGGTDESASGVRDGSGGSGGVRERESSLFIV